VIPIPLRPYWNNKMTREAVRSNEQERFEKYLEIVYNAFPPSRLNHFEHNLDVWRQLWRVCELSDLLVVCADARHPLFHFPPSLYEFVVVKMKKRMVLVLNKIDLVPGRVLHAWQAHLEARYPGLEVLLFSSYPLPGTVTLEDHDLRVRRRNVLGLDGRANVKRPAPVGVSDVLDTWRRLAREKFGSPDADANADADAGAYAAGAGAGDDEDEDEDEDEGEDKYADAEVGSDAGAGPAAATEEAEGEEGATAVTAKATKVRARGLVRGMKAGIVAAATLRPHIGSERPFRAPDGKSVFTVGLVGHPNAGKSSIINAVLGRAAVSVSNTPGHTKHLQTIARVTVDDDIQLCDCPGLVFPAADMPRPLQVLMGIFPLPQLREPYSCVEFLAERLLLVEVFALVPYAAADSDCAATGALTPGQVVSYVAPGSAAAAAATAAAAAAAASSAAAGPGRRALAAASAGAVSVDGYAGEHCAVSGARIYPHFLPGTISSPLPTRQQAAAAAPGVRSGPVAGSKGGAKGGKGGKGRRGGADEDEDDVFARVERALAEELTVSGSAGSASAAARGGDGGFSAPRYVWSAFRICEAYAAKKGWREDNGRPDTFRAGIDIIRDCLEGRLPLFFIPSASADDDE
jgi:ribosome biogenesis GTPase A